MRILRLDIHGNPACDKRQMNHSTLFRLNTLQLFLEKKKCFFLFFYFFFFSSLISSRNLSNEKFTHSFHRSRSSPLSISPLLSPLPHVTSQTWHRTPLGSSTPPSPINFIHFHPTFLILLKQKTYWQWRGDYANQSVDSYPHIAKNFYEILMDKLYFKIRYISI